MMTLRLPSLIGCLASLCISIKLEEGLKFGVVFRRDVVIISIFSSSSVSASSESLSRHSLIVHIGKIDLDAVFRP
jgi:hypothetical protein